MPLNQQYLIVTPSGLRSFSFLPSEPNTFQKTIHLVLNSLQPEQRHTFSLVLGTFPWPSVLQVKKLIESLSDAQFDVFIGTFNGAAIPRIRKYLEICALPHTPSQQLNQGHATICPYHKSAFTVQTEIIQDSTPIVQHMHDSPSEIFQVIIDHFFEYSFTPGYLFPDQGAYGYGKHNFEGNFYYNPNPHNLLALNQVLLVSYQEAFWAENIWVVGPGHRKDTLDFLDRLGETSVRVKRMRLAFTIDDICEASDFHANIINPNNNTNRGLIPNNLDIMQCFSSECDSISKELASIWWSKYAALTYLHLSELTLDLRNAYGPDGDCLPNPVWMNTLPRFRNGMPTLTILARDAELVEDAYVIIAAINR